MYFDMSYIMSTRRRIKCVTKKSEMWPWGWFRPSQITKSNDEIIGQICNKTSSVGLKVKGEKLLLVFSKMYTSAASRGYLLTARKEKWKLRSHWKYCIILWRSESQNNGNFSCCLWFSGAALSILVLLYRASCRPILFRTSADAFSVFFLFANRFPGA